jgi:hypothetical protein
MVPCEYETERVSPTVAVIEARSTTVWLNQAHRGIPMTQAALQMWEAMLPPLDGVASLGATWQPALGEPFALPNERPPVCAAWPNLMIPIAPNNSERVLTLFRDVRPRTGFDSNVAALNNTVDELIRVAPSDSPKWVLMQSSGYATCETEARNTPDARVAAPHFANALRRGVRVMLFAVFPNNNNTNDFSWDLARGQDFDAIEAWAVAGGALRRNGPAHFWVWTETEAIASAIRDNVISPYYCHVRATVPDVDRDRVVLLSEQGTEIPRETGWRWNTDHTNFIDILGAYCESVTRSRSSLRFVTRQHSCYP